MRGSTPQDLMPSKGPVSIDPAFGTLADQLEALLDTHATDTPAVRAAYGRAMRLELAFFDTTYILTPRRPP
jgi:hypothetical protein